MSDLDPMQRDAAQLAAFQQAQRSAAIREQLTAAGFAVVSVEPMGCLYRVWLTHCWSTETAIQAHLLGTDIEYSGNGTDMKRGVYIVVK